MLVNRLLFACTYNRSNCLLTNTYYIERFYTIPIRQVGWAFDTLLLNFFHSKGPLLKLTTMYNNCHVSQKEKKNHFKVCMLLFWDWVLETSCICQHHCLKKNENKRNMYFSFLKEFFYSLIAFGYILWHRYVVFLGFSYWRRTNKFTVWFVAQLMYFKFSLNALRLRLTTCGSRGKF